MAKLTHREAMQEYHDHFDADVDNYNDAHGDLQFCAGDQWDESIRRAREAQGRPTVTVNRTGQFVQQISGDWRKVAPTVEVIPGDDDADPQIAEILDGKVREIEYHCGAARIYSWGVECAARCGIGHWRLGTRYEPESFDQEVYVERINDPLSVTWDAGATKLDRSDATVCYVSDLITRQEFARRWPGQSVSDFDMPHLMRGSTLYWTDHDLIRIASRYAVVMKPIKLGMTANGQVFDITDMDREMIRFLGVVRERKGEKPTITHQVMSGNDWLTDVERFPGKYIPIVPVIGEEIPLEGRTVRHGIVRWMKDPQRLYNLWRSLAMETIGLQPKAPFLVANNAIDGLEAMWARANTANLPYLLYNSDPNLPDGGRPKREMPPQPPAAMWEEARIASEDMHATSGIYPASLGAKSNETSGRAIEARQRESDTTNYVYFDNANQALQRTGEIMVCLIQEVYDGERTIRVLDREGEQGAVRINQMVQDVDGPAMVNDITSGKYNVRIKAGPNYATAREQAVEQMRELITLNPEIFGLIGDIYVESLNIPGGEKMAERLRNALPPQILGQPMQPEQPDPMMQMQMEMQMQQGQLQIEGAAADVEKKQAEAEGKHLDNAMKEQQLRMGPIEMQFNQQLQQQKLQMAGEQAKAKAQQSKAKQKEKAA